MNRLVLDSGKTKICDFSSSVVCGSLTQESLVIKFFDSLYTVGMSYPVTNYSQSLNNTV